MTDKQIIVNGGDVSGCIYYQYNMCTATKDNYGDCSFYCKDYDMNDCYYKQLQREKQNSQEAIDASIREFNRAEELKTLLKRKKQECEKYKQTITKIKEISEKQCICGVYCIDMKQILQLISEVKNER